MSTAPSGKPLWQTGADYLRGAGANVADPSSWPAPAVVQCRGCAAALALPTALIAPDSSVYCGDCARHAGAPPELLP